MKIKGSKKPDDLVGTDEDDKILGLGGDDNITAKGGHDTVDAGKGDDKIVIAANTSANVDAGKGNDSVKVNAGALGSTIDLGKGSDTVEIKSSTATGQTFTIIGADSDDAVNFALGQDAYTVTENGAEGYTVVDASGNSYSLSGVSDLTFDGIPYTPSNPVNDAPVVSTPIADQTATANTAYSFQFSATAFTDPDSDALTYTASLANGGALPSWLAYNAATRTFSGTPTASNVGAVSVRVTASDGSLSATDDFTITVGNTTTPPPPPPPIVDPVVNGRILMLTSAYDYDVSESGGIISVSYAGRTKTYNSADIDGVDTRGSTSVDINTAGWNVRDITGDVNYANVIFTQAGPGGAFHATFELGPDAMPVGGDATVNNNPADYFRAAWEWLDNEYVQSPAQYYAEELNSFGIDIGIQYALYLKNGGASLLDIAKFTADGGDAGSTPDRSQILHDNLLGNLDENSIIDKFNAKPAASEFYTPDVIRQRIQDALGVDWLGAWNNINDGRGIYTGDEIKTGQTAHIRAQVFDYAHGFDRPDYISFDDSGTVDAQAIKTGGTMYFGTGNSPNGYVISQHEGAGVETALKVHIRNGADYVPTAVTSGNVVHFNVDSGAGSAASWGTPAKWNFDYSITTGLNGSMFDMDDFDFKIRIDTDSTGAVAYKDFELLTLGVGNTPFVAVGGGIAFADEDGTNSNIAQNSVNFGFSSIEPFLDSGAYNFGTGTFDIELLAYEAGTSNVLSNVHIQVHVV